MYVSVYMYIIIVYMGICFSSQGETRNGIPRDEVGEVNLRGPRVTYIYRVTGSNVGTRSFDLSIMGFDRLTGSQTSVTANQLQGVSFTQIQPVLRTTGLPFMFAVSVVDQTTIRIVVNGAEVYLIRLADGESCMNVSGFTYSDSNITVGSNAFPNIDTLVRVERDTGSVTFEGMAPNDGEISTPGLLCISSARRTAFFTPNAELTNQINNLIRSINVRPPRIERPVGPPVTITMQGGSAVIGGSVSANADLDIVFICNLVDPGLPTTSTRTWRFGSMDLTDLTGSKYFVAPSRLIIRRVEASDSGMYSCTARNSVGMDVASSSLTVIQPTQPTTIPPTTPAPVRDEPMFRTFQWSAVSCLSLCPSISVFAC